MTNTLLVQSQYELDKALADGVADLRIEHPLGIYLTISDDPGFCPILRGNSHAVLRGNASAVLWGNSHAELWGNARAELWGNSRAELWGNSRAVLWENSHATLRGNASATLRENASAELWENASAELWGNSRAELWENASAELWENSRAKLWGNSRAELWRNSRAELSRFTVAWLHSSSAKATGTGHVIDVTDAALSTPDAWAEYHGVKVVDGIATVYKALYDHFGTGRLGWEGKYAPGETPEAPDWRDDASCGGGFRCIAC